MKRDRIGNHAAMKPRALGTGSGSTHRRTPFGHITIAGKAGDVKRLTAAEMFHEDIQLAVYTQASAGSVEVYITLADMDLAMSPDQDVGDHWVMDHVAAPGVINQTQVELVTAVKLVFLSDAILYVAGA